MLAFLHTVKVNFCYAETIFVFLVLHRNRSIRAPMVAGLSIASSQPDSKLVVYSLPKRIEKQSLFENAMQSCVIRLDEKCDIYYNLVYVTGSSSSSYGGIMGVYIQNSTLFVVANSKPT